jgi:Fic-DOC domain mobile mystery protein B
MGLELNYIVGQTPIDENEKHGLRIPSITTREELDEFEQLNIEKAVEWTIKRKFNQEIILSEQFVKELHLRMYDDVWKWAGKFRITNKNIGVDWQLISVSLKQLLDDSKFWIENNTYPEDEIAVRFSHRIVSIHCFPNGNGRHSRLLADVIISHIFNLPVFSWGSSNLVRQGDARKQYIEAIHAADQGIILPLITFARS